MTIPSLSKLFTVLLAFLIPVCLHAQQSQSGQASTPALTAQQATPAEAAQPPAQQANPEKQSSDAPAQSQNPPVQTPNSPSASGMSNGNR